MKNIEAYMNELLEDTEYFNCTCCKLRLGYDPCKIADDMTKEECENHERLNKQWLKADYVSKEAIYILKSIDPKFTHIRKMPDGDIIVSNGYIPLPEEQYVNRSFDKRVINVISDVFQSDIFDFLPSGKNVLISDLLEQYKDVY